MKGVILAGGSGTRLRPLTTQTNKHLLPVGMEPMIWHSIRQCVAANVLDILVITSPQHMGDIVNSLGSGRQWNCRLTYRVQDEPEGIADGLALAEDFAHGEPIVLLLGDNIFQYAITPYLDAFRSAPHGARVLLKSVEDPCRFGIAEFENGKISHIVEKPTHPTSTLAVVGCYCYDYTVFERLKKREKSQRGEYEITHLNNSYLKTGNLNFSLVEGAWADAGTFEAYFEANHLLFAQENRIETFQNSQQQLEQALVSELLQQTKPKQRKRGRQPAIQKKTPSTAMTGKKVSRGARPY